MAHYFIYSSEIRPKINPCTKWYLFSRLKGQVKKQNITAHKIISSSATYWPTFFFNSSKLSLVIAIGDLNSRRQIFVTCTWRIRQNSFLINKGEPFLSKPTTTNRFQWTTSTMWRNINYLGIEFSETDFYGEIRAFGELCVPLKKIWLRPWLLCNAATSLLQSKPRG